MERLTANNGCGYGFIACNDCVKPHCNECEEFKKQAERLAHYEELEENSLLLTLPCAIGGSIWVIYEDTELDESIIRGVEELHLSGYVREGEREFYTTYDENGTCDIETDKTFSNKAAAEQALKEREQNAKL